MSFAELHFIQARLQGGKVNKAKKGELKFCLPVGFCHDESNRICFDSDEQVRHTLELFFKVFKEQGSAYGVVKHFTRHHIQFPKRIYNGALKGKLIWEKLSQSQAQKILKNPSYAGTYVYGHRKYQKKLSESGQLKKSCMTLPMDEWSIMIKDHHKGYISWENYLDHQNILKQNHSSREENRLPTNAREGLALLQGLLICGECDRRLSTSYKNKGKIYPIYSCNRKQKEKKEARSCFSVRATPLDQALSEKVLMAINPAQIEIAIKAFEELEQRNQSLEKQWFLKIERSEYEAQLAQRRYEGVDPSNRLVAGTLEKDWNDALTLLQQVRSQYAEYQEKHVQISTKEQKENILALAKDFPRLWNSPSTTAKDRKRILRLLIKDITVEKLKEEHKAILHIRWQGGALEDLEVPIPEPTYKKWKHSDEIIHRVRALALTMTDRQIAEKFNQEGLITKQGNSFTHNSIRGIRSTYEISPPIFIPGPEEFSINELVQKLNVSHRVIRYWVERDMVSAQRIYGKIWVSVDSEKEAELKNIIESSSKIKSARSKSRTTDPRGAL